MPIIAIRLEGEDREAATEIDPDMPVHRLGLSRFPIAAVRTAGGSIIEIPGFVAA